MPIKKKTNKKGKKHPDEKSKRILELKEDLEEYARVEKILGNGRASVLYPDNKTVLAHIRGNLRRCKLSIGDVVLVSIRTFQEDKCDIIYKYEKNEIYNLIKLGEIPPNFVGTSQEENNTNENIIFEEKDDTIFEFDDI